jgi:hypothetical protein
MWQETVQNGRAWTWSDYRAGAADYRPGRLRRERHRTEAGRTFWRQQDVVRIAGRWADAVGADHITLITVPPSGSDPGLLTRRFAEVAGFEHGRVTPVPRSNTSLGAPSAVVQQRLNAVLEDRGLAMRDGEWLRKEILGKQVLAARAAGEPKIGLEVARWVRRSSSRSVDELRAAGYRLVGAWDELDPIDVPGVDPDAVGERDLTASTEAALTDLATRVERLGACPPDPDLATAIDALAELVQDAIDQEGRS